MKLTTIIENKECIIYENQGKYHIMKSYCPRS